MLLRMGLRGVAAALVFVWAGVGAAQGPETVRAETPEGASSQSPESEAVAEGWELEHRPRWTVTVDPLTTALGFVHVQVEAALGDYVSLYLGPHMRLFTPGLGSDPAVDKVRGYGVEAGLRVFFQGTAPEGWWALVRTVGAAISDDTDSGFGGYTSILAGYTWIAPVGLVLSGGIGAQMLYYDINGEGPEGLAPALHTNIGFSF